jgi:2-hydroxychromene-2-carboxylate isomerase
MKFYYDVVCPYAYLASTRIEALAARAGQTIEWTPILLGGVFKSIGRDEAPMPAPKARINVLDMHRYAKLHGVPLALHPEHPKRTVSAMRLLHTVDGPDRVRLTHVLYRYYFVENKDISDKGVLAAAAAEIGRPEAAARIEEPEIKDTLRRATDEAVGAGVFGVPSFVIDGRLYWGQDRLALCLGEDIRPPAGNSGPREVSFFYDFSSPYAYLGATQVDAVAAAHGARVKWHPFLLGALFKEIGTPVVPLESQSRARQAWTRHDLADWASFWGVPIAWPSRFPMRTVTALRVALAVSDEARPSLSRRIFHAYWAEDRDINDPDTLRALVAESHQDPALVDRALEDPSLKQSLIEATAAARDAGLCGAPSFLAGDELLWGQDRLPLLARLLAGRPLR